MAAIEMEELRKEFGDIVAVEDVSLEVESGELLCLLGPSGCGKSTTLRMIAGLETPTEGRVRIDGEDVTDEQPYDRDCSMVFQSWALFPYKSVLGNVAFGLKMQGVGKAERHERAREILGLMHMDGFADARPTDLSGGQKQRVALARSLAMDPAVLLLDEPLSNLDKKLREEMQLELKNVHQEFQKTMVHVTHDQDEAFTLADRIGIMNEGRLVQTGEPREVYRNPKNRFIEEFIGETNLIEGRISNLHEDEMTVDLEIGTQLTVPRRNHTAELADGAPVSVSLRPEALTMNERSLANETSVRANGGDRHRITGTINNLLYRGSTVRYFVDTGGGTIFLELSGSNATFDQDDSVELLWDPTDVLCFDAAGTTVWS